MNEAVSQERSLSGPTLCVSKLMFQLIQRKWIPGWHKACLCTVAMAFACATTLARAAEEPCRFVLEWGRQGAQPGEFDFPIGIAINRADEVFVTDFYQRPRAKVFSRRQVPRRIRRSRRFRAESPWIDEGNVYVAHAGIPPSKYDEERKRDKIAVFSAAGKPLREWGKFGDGDGEFDHARRNRDQSRRPSLCGRPVQSPHSGLRHRGKVSDQVGQQGLSARRIRRQPAPQGIFRRTDLSGLRQAGESLHDRGPAVPRAKVHVAEGAFLLAWGDNEVAPGKFGDYFTAFGKAIMQGPTGICFDAQGRLWINSIGGRIQQFSDRENTCPALAKREPRPGQFYAPHGLAIDSHGCLYVVDAFNHRIQKFEVAR